MISRYHFFGEDLASGSRINNPTIRKPIEQIAPEIKKTTDDDFIIIKAKPTTVPSEVPRVANEFTFPSFAGCVESGIKELLQTKAAEFNILINTFKKIMKAIA